MSFYYDIFNAQEQIKENDIHTLNRYMYIKPISIQNPTCTCVANPLLGSIEPPPVFSPPVQPQPPKNASFFYPKNADPLFWCIYILLNGYTQYMEIEHHYGNVEMNEKQKLIEMIQKTPSIFKNSIRKITKTAIQEIMSDLMTNKKTSFDTANAFALYNQKKITFLYEKNKSYMVVGEQTAPNLNIYITTDKHNNIKWGIGEQTPPDENWFCIENPYKPLKTIGNYKLNELEEIAKKYQIYNDGIICKKKKQELYDDISNIFLFPKIEIK
jgi:hypothetical protein